MRKFGLIADLRHNLFFDSEWIIEAFREFSKDLTPKHLKSTSCHLIVESETIELLDDNRIVMANLSQHEFGESSWLTDWYYLLPVVTNENWLNISAMVGPGPILNLDSNLNLDQFNRRLVVECDKETDFKSSLTSVLKNVYFEDGARKMLSKHAKAYFQAEHFKRRTVLKEQLKQQV